MLILEIVIRLLTAGNNHTACPGPGAQLVDGVMAICKQIK